MPEQDASKPDPDAGEPAEHHDRHHFPSLVTSLVSPPRSVAYRVGKLLRRRWAVHLALIVNSLLVVVLSVLVVGFLSNGPEAPLVIEQEPKAAPSYDGEDPFVTDTRSVSAPPESSSASWQRAEQALAGKRFVEAMKGFQVLSVLAQSDPKGSLLADFFDLRGGECLRMMAMPAQARTLLLRASESRSLAVRATANYQLAVLDEQEGHYLQARLRAYLAVGAGASLPFAPALEKRCDVLIARALTKKALSYHDSQDAIEWSSSQDDDPFSGLDEAGLRRLLVRGAEDLSAAMLGPKVDPARVEAPARRWAATCWRAPVEDFLTRFATRAEMDLRWVRAAAAVRGRPISLHFAGASMPRLCEVAAGSAGLIARFTGDEIIVHNPTDVESLEQHRALLIGEAISAWRRFFLRAPSDGRVVEGHFAVAALHEFAGETMDAISEYQLIAGRFTRTRFAPLALLRSARLRTRLRDFAGARKDLTDLLDGYPDCHQSADAYATLGEVTMESGHPAEAFRIFRKLYFLDLSSSSRAIAAFGAGKCLHSQGKHEEAAKWLNTFVRSAVISHDDNLPVACLMLGRSCVGAGMDKEAVGAFQLAMVTGIDEHDRTEARIELAQTHWRLGYHASAITTVGNIDPELCTGGQNYRILLLTTQIYRDMGLPDRAGRYLTSNLSSIVNQEYQIQLVVELARCYRDSGQSQLAYQALAGVLAKLPSGGASALAACELAEICLATDKPGQAVTVLEEVLGSSKAAAHHPRARKLLFRAHIARRAYRSALLAASDSASKGETK